MFMTKMAVLVDVDPDLSKDGAKRIGDFVSQDRMLDSVDEFVPRWRSIQCGIRLCCAATYCTTYVSFRTASGRGNTIPTVIGRTSPSNVIRERSRFWTKSIESPVRRSFLRGARSDVFSDDNVEKFANALPQGGWRQVPDAGHTIQGDNSRGLLDALQPFINGNRFLTLFSLTPVRYKAPPCAPAREFAIADSPDNGEGSLRYARRAEVLQVPGG